jgi:hypothetical protein
VSSSIGNASYYSLIYVTFNLGGNSTLYYRLGSYSTSLAGALAGRAQCLQNCTWNLPIQWSAPIAIDSLGPETVEGDALAAANATVALAVSASGSTSVYFSPSVGSPGTWMSATGSTPISGTSPNITLVPCQGILVSTLTSTNLVSTTLPLSCPNWQTSGNPPAPPPSGGNAPYVTSISPTSGTTMTVVTVNGGNFVSSGLVYFGGVLGTAYSYHSASVVTADPPSGSGIVDVQVYASGQLSPIVPSDQFTYSGSSPPTVTSVSPTSGILGTLVTIHGTGFTSTGSRVQFGTAYSPSVSYVSSTKLTATAPAGSGTINVTVTTSGGTSARSSADHFTYLAPSVSGVAPPYGYPTNSLQVLGSNIATGASVVFGGIASPLVVMNSSGKLTAQIPWGYGTVNIRITNPGGMESAITAADVFHWIGLDLAGNRTSQLLPLADSAQPVWVAPTSGLPGTLGILAANSSTQTIVFYSTTAVGGLLNLSAHVATYVRNSGSSVLTTIGATRLEVSGGPGGLVAVTSEGPNVFGLFTTREENRTVVQTVTSANLGLTWGQSFIATSTLASVSSPSLAVSPAGYVYATWLDNGAGPWQVDAQTFAPSGRPLQNVTVIPGSQGSEGSGATNPAVAVDGLQRPLYAWAAVGSTASSQIFATGEFLSPGNAAAEVWTTLNATGTSDFLHSGSSASIGAYKGALMGNLTTVITDGRERATCNAISETLDGVYPYVGWALASSFENTTSSCGVFHAIRQPLVASVAGAASTNTTMSIETQWLLESLGFGVFSTPAWIPIFPAGQTSAGVTFSTGGSAWASGSQLNVQATGINPKTVELNITSVFETFTGTSPKLGTSTICSGSGSGALYEFGWYTNVSIPLNLTTSVWTVTGGTPGPHQSYVSNGSLMSVYLTNLSFNTHGSWYVQTSASYQESVTWSGYCPVWEVNHFESYGSRPPVLHTPPVTPGWPSSTALTTSGVYSDQFGFRPGTVPAISSGSAIVANWTNSLLASGSAGLFESTPSHWLASSGGPTTSSLLEKFSFGNVPTNQAYVLYANATSAAAQTLNWSTTYSGSNTATAGTSPAQATCSFTLGTNPITLGWNTTGNVSNITSTSAVLTWRSNLPGVGWVNYHEAYGNWLSAYAQTWAWNGQHYFQADLKGLTPWGAYTAEIGVTVQSSAGSCLYYQSNATWTFATAAKFALAEVDLPYDSISQQGGGAYLNWQIPSFFASKASYKSGYLTYWPVSNPANATILPLPENPVSDWCFYCYLINITPETMNLLYAVSLVTNFTYGGQNISGSSFPFTFWYERDTSGDGLTDWEKDRGWPVTYQNLSGVWRTEWVSANPLVKATNGLVNDFVEKEFGLNPAVVDTSYSHMLDTWNLTFDLGSKRATRSIPAGANFHYFTDAGNVSTDYVWTNVCQYYVPPNSGSCALGSLNPGTSWANLTGNDSAEWASRVLWNRSALEYFISLPAVQVGSWLRATLGDSGYNWTLTIWGKLSWGANPLAASTPGDGFADGARVNALYGEDLEVESLSSSLTSCLTPPSRGQSYGWAPQFYLNWSTVTGPVELAASGEYGAQGYDNLSSGGTHACGSISSYQVPIPINDTSQNQSLQVRLILNESNSTQSTALKPQQFNGSLTVVSVSYNEFAGVPKTFGMFSGNNGNLKFTLATTVIGVKDPTYLWQADNSTSLTNLPWGLKRYAGEQGFGLIVLDAATGLESDLIESPQNSSIHYRVNLSAGLNSILVPRGQLFSSVFGQSILLGRPTGWSAGSNEAPLLGLSQAENNSIDYGSSNPLLNLGCYWQNRAINTNISGSLLAPICNGTAGLTGEVGTALTNSKNIEVVAETASAPNNTGGTPWDPYLESTTNAGAALQVLATLNLSATSGLDLLLASLLDNVTGGVNGSFLPVTDQVPTLGLPPVVVQELANQTLNSSGFFGVPWGIVPPTPTPPCNSLGCWFKNAVGGIAWVGSDLASYGWNPALAATCYFNDVLPTPLRIDLATVRARGVEWLVYDGALLASASNDAATWIKEQVASAIAYAVGPLKSARAGIQADWVTAFYAQNNTTGGQNSPAADTSIETSLGSIGSDGNTASAALEIGLTALDPFSAVLGPVSGVVMLMLLTALGATTHGNKGATAETGASTFAVLLGYVGAAADAVVADGSSIYRTPEEQMIQLLEVILAVGPISLGFLTLVASQSSEGLGAFELGMGLELASLVMVAFTPCARLVSGAVPISWGLVFAILGEVALLIAAGLGASPIAVILGSTMAVADIGLALYADQNTGC